MKYNPEKLTQMCSKVLTKNRIFNEDTSIVINNMNDNQIPLTAKKLWIFAIKYITLPTIISIEINYEIITPRARELMYIILSTCAMRKLRRIRIQMCRIGERPYLFKFQKAQLKQVIELEISGKINTKKQTTLKIHYDQDDRMRYLLNHCSRLEKIKLQDVQITRDITTWFNTDLYVKNGQEEYFRTNDNIFNILYSVEGNLNVFRADYIFMSLYSLISLGFNDLTTLSLQNVSIDEDGFKYLQRLYNI